MKYHWYLETLGLQWFTHVYSMGNMGREKHVGQFVLQSQQFHLIRIHLSLDLFGDRQKILRISISNGGYYYYGLLDLKIHIGYPIKENSQAEYGFDWK